jgi:ABC-type branched-subunit amino acid transport system ATPase component
VRENVAVGIEAALAGATPWNHLFASSRDTRAIAKWTDYALDLCELAELAGAPATTLSTGQRRLVELARCVAGDYRILMLDEPVSGLDRVETQRFAGTLQRLVAERGCGILLVEHDMSVALEICDRLYVLDFGNLIFTGTPAEVIASPAVRSAYLGDTSVELPSDV